MKTWICPVCYNEFIKNRKDKIYCCRTHKESKKNRRYILDRKDFCEMCWFIPLNMCQLDVHHKDWNHKNDTISNLMTLCANCHRLESYLNQK